jgi:protein tyrosine/serine phosphatase
MADQTLPSPPFVQVNGIQNLRDAGGYAIESQPGKIVKPGVIFRASEPSKVTPEGIATLRQLGITDVYDLRSQQEIERDGRQGYGRQVKEWEGATRHFTPVFLSEDYSPEAIALRFKNYAHETSEVSGWPDIVWAW